MSVLFYPESIRILGSDANGNNVMLCEMAVDDTTNLPAANAFINDGYVLSMGCVATAINDNSKHRLNGSGNWVQIAAGTSTYTRAEIDAFLSAIDAEIAEDRAALAEVENKGAKNLVNAPNGSGVRFINIPIVLEPGDYYVLFQNISSTDTDAATCQFGAFYEDDSQASNFPQLKRGDNTGAMFSVSKQTSYVRVYASSSFAGGGGDTVTFTGCMICTKAEWDISNAYEQYAPTNRQLYEMILELQGG